MIKPPSCNSCNLLNISSSFSKPYGKGNIGVTIIGDHLDYDSTFEGTPFKDYSQSGIGLDWAISATGKTKSQFNLTNLVQCALKDDKILKGDFGREAISHCYKKHTDSNIFRFTDNPVVLALGPVATYNLTEWSGSDTDKTSLEYIRGYPTKYIFGTKYNNGVWVVPTYHPRTVKTKNPVLMEYIKRDLRLALRIAEGSFTPKFDPLEDKDYRTQICVDDLLSYYYFLKDNSSLPIFYDIETPNIGTVDEDTREKMDRNNLNILQAQFSHKKNFGITFPYTEAMAKIAKKIMRLPNDKVGHNSYGFDDFVMENNGFRIEGNCFDTMWLVKHAIPGLDLNLQSCASMADFQFTWKHLFGENLELYCCADVDAPAYVFDKFKKYMQAAKPRIDVTINGLPQKLTTTIAGSPVTIISDLPEVTKSLWDGYGEHVKDYYQLQLKGAREIGIPFSFEGYDVLCSDLVTQIDLLYDELQFLVPDSIKPAKQKNGLKKEPKVIGELRKSYYSEGQKDESLQEYIFRKSNYQLRLFTDENLNEVERWIFVNPFKPSNQQVKKYISWKQSTIKTIHEKNLYKLPVNRKSKAKKAEDRTTTGKDALKDIFEKTGDEVIGKIVEIRSLAKMLKNDLKHWKPNSRTTFWGEETEVYESYDAANMRSKIIDKKLIDMGLDDDVPF